MRDLHQENPNLLWSEYYRVLYFRWSPSSVLIKGFSANMQQIYRKTPMQKCNIKHLFRRRPLGDSFWFKETFHFLYPLKCGTHELLSITENIIKNLFAQADCQLRTSSWHGSFILLTVFFAKPVLRKYFNECTVNPIPRAMFELKIRTSHIAKWIWTFVEWNCVKVKAGKFQNKTVKRKRKSGSLISFQNICEATFIW